MSVANRMVETVFVVGAGFSHHAGLPLTSTFTEAVLEGRGFRSGVSRLMVEFLTQFIRDTFDVPTRAGAKHWPELEDVFTCLDLSANSGHHLGDTFAPADLRTVRRAMLCRIIRMLNQKYEAGRKKKGPEWKGLDDFFWQINPERAGFISMNWDTVIERKFGVIQRPLIDYCCDALHAGMPERPQQEGSWPKYIRELGKSQTITLAPTPIDRRQTDASTPVVKIHGSANWLYCDNCRRLFWLAPTELVSIANQIIRHDDISRINMLLPKKKRHLVEAAMRLQEVHPQVRCICSEKVALGVRIATFSYRKELDFPMFQKSWLAAEELLQSARKWVFIGYSLPAADYEFKYLLKRTQLSRRESPELVVITGGNENDAVQTLDNYRKFFGRAVHESNSFTHGLTPDAVAACCKK